MARLVCAKKLAMEMERGRGRRRHSHSESESGSYCWENASEDVMKDILGRLPAKSVASAACVCRTWRDVTSKLLSSPKLMTALSLNPNLEAAMDDIMRKILAKPIRPNFAIAFTGKKFNLSMISTLLKANLGSRIPIVACYAVGIIGPDAIDSEQKEVKWRQPTYGSCNAVRCQMIAEQHGLVITIGYFPGLEIEAIPLHNSFAEGELKSFVTNMLNYTNSVSDNTHPLAVILLSDPRADIRHMLESLERGLSGNTVIIGGLAAENEGACLSFNSRENSKVVHENQYTETSTSKKCRNKIKGQGESPKVYDAVALVFAKSKNSLLDSARIQFSPAVSGGLAPVGPIYKAVSVRVYKDDVEKVTSTWLTCRKEGMHGELDGESVLDDLDSEVEGDILSGALYIGVSRRTKCTVGKDKARVPFRLHEVHGADEEYLFVEGEGIKTEDVFRFYRTDSETGKATTNSALEEVRNKLKSQFHHDGKITELAATSMASNSNENDNKVLGGLLFACMGRGESYFSEPNVESSIFSCNFPDAPIGGMYCLGEIGPPSVLSWEATKGRDTNSRLNFYSSMFLVFSRTLKMC